MAKVTVPTTEATYSRVGGATIKLPAGSVQGKIVSTSASMTPGVIGDMPETPPPDEPDEPIIVDAA